MRHAEGSAFDGRHPGVHSRTLEQAAARQGHRRLLQVQPQVRPAVDAQEVQPELRELPQGQEDGRG